MCHPVYILVAPDSKVEARHAVLVVVQGVTVDVAASLEEQAEGVVPADGGRLRHGPQISLSSLLGEKEVQGGTLVV